MQLTTRFVLLATALIGAFPLPCPAQRDPREWRLMTNVPPAPPPMNSKAENSLADSLAWAISNRPPGSPPFRVAVFPFGDQEWDFQNHRLKPPRLTLRSIETQGIITSSLRKSIPTRTRGKFVLLDAFGLQLEFERAHIDPVSINPNNKDLPAILKELNIDAAVVGTCREAREGNLNDFPSGEFTASIVLANAKPSKIDVPGKLYGEFGNFGPLDMQKRVSVSLESRPDPETDWKPIPMVKDKREFGSEVFAVLDKADVGAEYRVRVFNIAFGPEDESYLGMIGNPVADFERNRIFGVSVLIDGINSFYQDTGAGQRGPVALHPADARKWVLAPPGTRVVPVQPGRDQRPGLLPVEEQRYSSVEVLGFQDGPELARAFEFATVADRINGKGVIAETLGISQSIGLISVYVFSKKILGDKFMAAATSPGVGTAAGRQFIRQVFDVDIQFHPQPVYQMHINYRLREEVPFPRQHWEFIETFQP